MVGGNRSSIVPAMPLDGESGILENFRELQSKVSVGEVNDAHAARSKRTASSIVWTLSS